VAVEQIPLSQVSRQPDAGPSVSATGGDQSGRPVAPAYMTIAADGAVADWNEQAERMFGWNRQEVSGRLLADTVVATGSAALVAATAARLLAQALGPAGGQRLELDARNRHGLTFPVEIVLWASPQDGTTVVSALVTDISERRRTEDHLHRMASLVQALDEAVLGVSLDGRILSWNTGAARSFGYKGFEVIGLDMAVLVPEERRSEVARWWARLRDGAGAQSHETVGVRRNGVRIDVAVTISPIRGDGDVATGASVIVRDITAQRWTADTLESTLRSLEEALKAAQASEARCRRFLADAAHQLRTPIAGIRACSETLLRGAPPDQRDHLLLDVVRETARASRVMTGLLRIARADDDGALRFTACDVAAVCADEVARCRAVAPALDVDLRTPVGHQFRPVLDANVVREVLANLLDNARRHAVRRIEVIIKVSEGDVEIHVRDDGPGIPADAVERAFERFISLDGHGGSGLGLPIARDLAQAHGGDLTYDGEFVLCLPGRPEAMDCGGSAWPRSSPSAS